MKIKSSEFKVSAPNLESCPKSALPEFAKITSRPIGIGDSEPRICESDRKVHVVVAGSNAAVRTSDGCSDPGFATRFFANRKSSPSTLTIVRSNDGDRGSSGNGCQVALLPSKTRSVAGADSSELRNATTVSAKRVMSYRPSPGVGSCRHVSEEISYSRNPPAPPGRNDASSTRT